MSRVYFHAEDDDAELRGPERAYAGGVCGDLFAAAMGLTDYLTPEQVDGYRTLFPVGHYVRDLTGDPRYVKSSIRTAFAVGSQFFTATINTALVMGSDAVKLLARLHGQCEIHAYVEGPDRLWLADIIERGRADKVLRADMGWENVITLLRSSDSGPVVTSYSVCEQFPNPSVAGWEGEDDAWYALPSSEQWRRAIDGLYASGDRLRIKPDDWQDFYFGDGTTAFDLLQSIHEHSRNSTV